MSGFKGLEEGVNKGKRNRDDETDNDDTDVKKNKNHHRIQCWCNSRGIRST